MGEGFLALLFDLCEGVSHLSHHPLVVPAAMLVNLILASFVQKSVSSAPAQLQVESVVMLRNFILISASWIQSSPSFISLYLILPQVAWFLWSHHRSCSCCLDSPTSGQRSTAGAAPPISAMFLNMGLGHQCKVSIFCRYLLVTK